MFKKSFEIGFNCLWYLTDCVQCINGCTAKIENKDNRYIVITESSL